MKRTVIKLVAVGLAGLILLGNVRLHRPGSDRTTGAQLEFLARSLDEGGAERMQRWFPEGYVFTWALYGLASAQHARGMAQNDPARAYHLGAAEEAVWAVRTDSARSTFDPDLSPPRGAFYSAWSLYVLAEYVRATGKDAVSADVLTMFRDECDRFVLALESSESPFLESYRSLIWPADTAVGIAALGIYDSAVGPRYGPTIEHWVTAARARLDPRLGALSHSAAPGSGAPLGGARGGSLALMSRVLIDADSAFAAEQFSILRERFVDYRLGLPGVREYAHGIEGVGDVDSGPVILGFAGPATVVGAGAARVHGDLRLAEILLGVVEMVGVPIQGWRTRRYGGGMVPVGDAFVAWSRSSPIGLSEWPSILPRLWHLPVHLVSGLLLTLLAIRVKWALGRLQPRNA
ncbi:MAG: hypothetical protein OEO79_08845 [Gemmatimonadota bacterium]|nr:hypothetical protein [Gemmatimonadota bacterium]